VNTAQPDTVGALDLEQELVVKQAGISHENIQALRMKNSTYKSYDRRQDRLRHFINLGGVHSNAVFHFCYQPAA
jgi:hypothetical protein